MRHEVDADSRLIVLIEGVVDEAVDDRGLTHGLVPQEDDLVFEFGHACCAFKRLVFCHYINRIFYYNCLLITSKQSLSRSLNRFAVATLIDPVTLLKCNRSISNVFPLHLSHGFDVVILTDQ